MGIHNIEVIIHPDVESPRRQAQILEAHLAELVAAHRRGEHTPGNMRRECPLCQSS